MTSPVENCQKYTAEQVDLRNLIHADLQFEHRGETDLKLAELQSLVTRGWMQEGDENNEFDVTDVGHEVIAATLRQQAERGDGAASDDKLMDAVQESLLEYRLRNWADESGDSLSLLDHLSAGETIQSGREEIEQMADAVCEAVAPLLRAPAEQGGRVDDVILREAADEALTLLQQLDPQHGITTQLQATLAQNTLAQQVIDGKAQWDDLAGILGADGDNVDDVFAKAKSLTQNTQVGAVLEIGECAEVIWHQGGPCQLPPGAKLYLHAERARVPDGGRGHYRAVALLFRAVVADDSLAFSCQSLGQYRTKLTDKLDGFIAECTAPIAAAPSQPEDAA